MIARRERTTPFAAVGMGLVAGLVGTAAMTAYQELVAKAKKASANAGERSGGGDQEQPSWESAPAPAKVGKRILEGVFQQDVPPEKIGLLTNAMHWGYGTMWGAAYGVIQATLRRRPVVLGPVFGSGVWALSYAQLVPMGLYEPPWTYPAKTVATDISYHLVYGLFVGASYAALDRR